MDANHVPLATHSRRVMAAVEEVQTKMQDDLTAISERFDILSEEVVQLRKQCTDLQESQVASERELRALHGK